MADTSGALVWVSDSSAGMLSRSLSFSLSLTLSLSRSRSLSLSFSLSAVGYALRRSCGCRTPRPVGHQYLLASLTDLTG